MQLSHATLVGRVRRKDNIATADFESIQRSDKEDEPARLFEGTPRV